MGAARRGAILGRAVEGQAHYRGQAGAVRAVLESDALILRGAVTARIPRGGLRGWQATADALWVDTPEGPLVLTLGAAEAAKWVAALNRPLPTLAEKLGLEGQVLWLMCDPQDDILAAALTAVTRGDEAEATLGVAVLRSAAGLDRLLAVCGDHPSLPIWAVNEKGPGAGVPESAIRAALRAIGMVDVKACAVSATLSATRYQRRKG